LDHQEHSNDPVLDTINKYSPPISTGIVDEATHSSQWTFKGDCKNNRKDDGHTNNNGAINTTDSGDDSKSLRNDGSKTNEHKEIKISSISYVIPEALIWMNPFQRLMLYLARQEKVDNNTWQCLLSISLVYLAYRSTPMSHSLIDAWHYVSHQM
jgi:hypothetical protein